MNLKLPEKSLVLLVGSSGSGKSSFAQRHFLSTEVVSSDVCRGLVSDDENDQKSTHLAFELLHFMVGIRLRNRRMTVVDATNLRPEDRKSLRDLAVSHDTLCTAILFDTPRQICKERNASRPDRNFSSRVIDRHTSLFRQTVRNIKKERFHRVYRITPEDLVEIERNRLWYDKSELTGPFDIIGDLHGCADELTRLLDRLGYQELLHPAGRTLVFVGDITDRGPRNLDCMNLVRKAVSKGALCVCGNHDQKLKRYLEGRKLTIAHGMAETVAELDPLPDQEKAVFKDFLESLISHYVLDGGKLVVAHAGIKEEYQGKASGRVRSFCMYGDTTGEIDEFGFPVRLDWAADYRGEAYVVYGHTPVPEAKWINRTINIDTGCVFGGKLTALRYPEMELVQEAAERTYYEPVQRAPQAPERSPDEIKLSDLSGKQIVTTRLIPNITLAPELTAAALETISRFAVAPEWLVYLPPTMAPCTASTRDDYLEYPTEAFEFYAKRGSHRVMLQEKHMGSRAVLFLKRNGEGRCMTRTGRAFFPDPLARELVESLVNTLTTNGFWTAHKTNFVVLDAELMPWSAKAQALLQAQYAAVASAATAVLPQAVELLEQTRAPEDSSALEALQKRLQDRLANALQFRKAYRQYCWETEGLQGIKIAPFHLLATLGQVNHDETHRWHLAQLQTYLGNSALFHPTQTLEIDPSDPDQVLEGCHWWENLTAQGGEGMVVKPEKLLTHGRSGFLQPALKVRGREYLRIIYGPDYTRHLPALRQRAMSRKRSLALREFALGLQALETFVNGGPLYEVHRAVFGVLALESSPVDPRL
ncbi:MAG: polynucleotide kinase-phosphatase [Vulcanimicrobiota bacterium]